MADINPGLLPRHRAVPEQRLSTKSPASSEREFVTVVELLFFAYRDFTREADIVLSQIGLGRAHHRVLHFVNRNPGLRVADLLDILKITKQSLARVLKQLIDEGWITSKAGDQDRRQRRLHATGKGESLARRLDQIQARRVARALADAGAGHEESVRRFLFAMIAREERPLVESLLPVPLDRPGG
ncbi:MAG TPA: MarR family transcriptional regulator [Hyphomicrobiaceae bacterium]|jgi:DNA-binding MarR family transcriptional regulator|nr:MarR family transcriptional regulator [Hyphomicrobiaceae bacterium]